MSGTGERLLSAVISVTERHDDLAQLLREYHRGLTCWSGALEFVVVLDGSFPLAESQLAGLAIEGASIRVVRLGRRFGEATALCVGFEHASGDVLLTLPAYYQVELDQFGRLFAALEHADLVVARRWPRTDSMINRMQASGFRSVVRWLTKTSFNDLGCGVRALRRGVVKEVALYGDQHRFFPILAQQRGFRVVEVELAQSPRDRSTRFHGPATYTRRLLDLISVFFLVKFTRKPLRLFGLVGVALLAAGAVAMAWIVAERMFSGVSLSDRPALLLSTLLLVLGAQMLALGLIGELIIFTHAAESKEYAVSEVVEFAVPAATATEVATDESQGGASFELSQRREDKVLTQA